MVTNTDEQELADFEAWFATKFNADRLLEKTSTDGYGDAFALTAWLAYQAGRADLQSQPAIDDDHLSIILDVYDNAMQKAFDGREFQNPCKSGTPEHKAWEKGRKEGKKKRDAGLPNSIALQSQGREDGFSDGVLLALQMVTASGDAGSHLYCELIETAGLNSIVRRALQEGMWELAGLNAPMSDRMREAIDNTRRVEEGWDG